MAGLDLPQRETAGLEAPDEWIRERPVGFDGELSRKIGLVVRRDRQHVLRARPRSR